MEITIKKDKIIEISNITANTNSTNKAYTNDAKKGMVSKIIANGNADGVNTVAGATCSSKAIKDCLLYTSQSPSVQSVAGNE